MPGTQDAPPDPLGRVPYHLGIATRDIGASMEDVGTLFGVSWTPIAESVEPGLVGPAGPVPWTCRRVHSLGGPFHLELLEGSDDSVWATDGLAGAHHVAYWSDDVAGEIDALATEGWELEATLRDDEGRAKEFAYLSRPGDIRIELVASHRRATYLALTEPSESGT
jgi:hypothetical protein